MPMRRKAREVPPDELDEIIDIWLSPDQSQRDKCREDLKNLSRVYERPTLKIPRKGIRKELKKIRARLMNTLKFLEMSGQSWHHQLALMHLSSPQLWETMDLLEALANQTHVTGEELGRVSGGNLPDQKKRYFVRLCWSHLKSWPKGKLTKELLQGFAETLWKSFSGEEDPNFKRAVDDLYPELSRGGGHKSE